MSEKNTSSALQAEVERLRGELNELKQFHADVVEKMREMLDRQATACREEIEQLRGENEKLRAYAECAQCWREYAHDVHEDKSDWSKTLREHGWNPSENGPVEFIDSLRTAALTPTATGGTK